MKKILLVDDHDYMYDLITGILKDYNISYVDNVDDALITLKKETFDLVIVDLMIPKKSGFSLLPILKKRNIPNITLSNVKNKRISKDLLELTNAYINKGEIDHLKSVTIKILNGIEIEKII